jgi:hypothetical protein
MDSYGIEHGNATVFDMLTKKGYFIAAERNAWLRIPA